MYLVGTILFRADDKPEVHSAFAAAREAADAFRPQGLTHQFWGRALEVPCPFHWYLVWSGDADLAQADAALHSLVSRLPALKPPQTVFTVSVANSPVDALRAPIVGSVAWRVAPADIARASSWMDSASKLQVELNPRGLVAWCLSPTAAERGLYLGGWTSVEAHQNDLQEEGVKGERFRAASEEAYGCYETMDFYHVALVEHLPRPTPMYLVGTILFRADDTPEVRSAFAAAREAADAFRPQGLTHQFWGHAVETPRPFHWYLVWSGDADLAQADAALHSLVPRLPALKPPQTVFTVSMAASPVDAFRAPVVASVAWRVAPANVARAGPSMDCASKRQKELAPKGLVAWCLSPTLAERGLYLGGWTSIEAHYTDLQEESEKGERYRAASEAAYGCYETMDFYHVALVEHLPRPTMMYLVGTILFRADDTPEVRDAFAAAREAADAFRPQGLTHQFWGRAFETPRPFHWYLIWSGDADLAQADAALHSLISRLPALKPPQTVFTVPVTNSPVDACRAPIVASAAWHIAPADVTRAGPTVDYAAKQIVALDPSGLVAWCLSPTVAERGLYLGGWTSLEAHQNDLLVEGEKGDRYRAASEAAYGFFAALDFYHVALVEHVPDGRS